jgi:hypothetical protein
MTTVNHHDDATHVHQQLVDETAYALGTVTALSNKVFPGRVYPLDKEEFPAAFIFVEDEKVSAPTRSHQQPAPQMRDIEIAIYLFARDKTNVLSALNALQKAVEAAMFMDYTLGKVCNSLRLDHSHKRLGGSTDVPTGAVRMSFIASVITKEGSPEKSLMN